MTRGAWILAVLAAAGAGVVAGALWAGSGAGGTAGGGEEAEAPSVKIQAEAVRRMPMDETVVAWGSVVAAPGQVEAFSLSFECRVNRVLVTPGQAVEAGAPLVEVEPSAETRLQLDEARSDLAGARAEAGQVRLRVQARLATNQDLIGAAQRLRSADLRVRSLERRHAATVRTLVAAAAGTVGAIEVHPGGIVASGNRLLDVVAGGRMDVRLGIEPADATRVLAGQPASLRRVHGADGEIQGTVRGVAGRVDPETRLVEAFVTPAEGAGLRLGEAVRGAVRVGSHEALVVPRAALVPQDGGLVLFTIEEGRARVHAVQPGLQDAALAEVLGTDLREGQRVATVGAAELADGMAVQAETDR